MASKIDDIRFCMQFNSHYFYIYLINNSFDCVIEKKIEDKVGAKSI